MSTTTTITLSQYKENGFTVPDGLSLIQFDVGSCTFRRSLDCGDLGIDESKISKEIANLGSKAVINKDVPKDFRRIYSQLKRYMNTNAVPFGGNTWAVLTSEYDEVWQEIHENYQTRWLDLKASVKSNYKERVDEFADVAESLMPGFGQIIRKNAFSEEYIDRQIRFNVIGEKEMDNIFQDNSVKGLATIAEDYQTEMFKRSPIRITRLTRNKLVEMHEYCERFGFLTNKLSHARRMIENVINQLPQKVTSTGDYQEISGIVLQLLINLQHADRLTGIQFGGHEELDEMGDVHSLESDTSNESIPVPPTQVDDNQMFTW